MKDRPALLFLFALWFILLGFTLHAKSALPVTAGHDNTIVIDGDTIQIAGDVFQLSGIDAPELGQICGSGWHPRHCGLDAAYALRKLISLATPPITCYRIHADVASCIRGDEDLSIDMIKAGHAVAAPEGSFLYAPAEAPLFRRVERAAKASNMGIWGSAFSTPWQWRQQKETSDRTHLLDPTCMVKGKVTKAGDRFYYGPLDEVYDQLSVDPKKGERLFCSDDQARASGWRRAGQTNVKSGADVQR